MGTEQKTAPIYQKGWARSCRPDCIKNAREAKGLSIRALAEQSGVERTKIQRWEKGKGFLLIGDAIRLAKCLGSTVEDLFRAADDESSCKSETTD